MVVCKITPGFSVVNSTGINVAYRIRLAKRGEITEAMTKLLYEELHEI
jgi:hypothetical protein